MSEKWPQSRKMWELLAQITAGIQVFSSPYSAQLTSNWTDLVNCIRVILCFQAECTVLWVTHTSFAWWPIQTITSIKLYSWLIGKHCNYTATGGMINSEGLRQNSSGNWVIYFQWTKTLYQNNLKNIALFCYIFQGLKM